MMITLFEHNDFKFKIEYRPGNIMDDNSNARCYLVIAEAYPTSLVEADFDDIQDAIDYVVRCTLASDEINGKESRSDLQTVVQTITIQNMLNKLY